MSSASDGVPPVTMTDSLMVTVTLTVSVALSSVPTLPLAELMATDSTVGAVVSTR